jgi:hypothetical protein
VNNLEELMAELARASVVLKRALYRRDDAAATSPEGVDAPTVVVHTCLVCERSAAGQGAQVRHSSNCELAQIQRAQKALRESWPELFTKKPAPEALPVKCVTHPGGGADPVGLTSADGGSPAYFPPPAPRATRPKGRGHIGREAGPKAGSPDSRSSANGSPSAQTGHDASRG